jgi:hypothetical protein
MDFQIGTCVYVTLSQMQNRGFMDMGEFIGDILNRSFSEINGCIDEVIA